MTDPVLVWGAGAIGGTLGAGLARAGHDVVMVDAVLEHVNAINERGLEITGPIFQDVIRVPAFTPQSVKGEYRRIVLAVKALHTRDAAESLRSHLSPDGYVVSAQNGLNEATIAEVVGQDRTVGCFVNFGADYIEPGIVQFSGRGSLVVGEIDGRESDRLNLLRQLLQDFEPNARVTDNISGYLWGKLIYGSLLFATALTNDSIADVLDDPTFRDVLTRLAQEVGSVAQAERIRPEAFDGFYPSAFMPNATQEATKRSFQEMIIQNRKSAKSHTGIWRDLAVRKRRTECEPQLQPIVAAGRRGGVPTPLTERLIALIQDLENGRRGFSRENLVTLATAGAAQTGIVR